MIPYELSMIRVLLVLLAICLLLVIRLRVSPKTAVRFQWSIGQPVPKNPDPRKEKVMIEVKITNEQKIAIGVNPVTATGKPAKLDGEVQFEVQSGDVTIERIDANNAFIVSGDLPGDSVVSVSADVDLGEGREIITDIVKITVEGARAASLGLTIGEPIAK